MGRRRATEKKRESERLNERERKTMNGREFFEEGMNTGEVKKQPEILNEGEQEEGEAN